MRRCNVSGCENVHDSKGYCKAHYHKWRRYGDPLYQHGKPLIARVLGNIALNGECWEWQGKLNHKGYGLLNGKDTRRVHRIVWEELNGPIPDGLFVCHACDNPRCVNPQHLWVGTHQDNMDDMMSKGRHACQKA